ncbi:MAG: hypothetical protein Q4G22_10200 [Paracoccus sp. (in: a-proteobacteria)]|uniref:hypothetical protein n=1 Tax=Paracoccus sp. TaxID=267 RepID=UPI0026E0BB3D|nr:hypothetical protein [Paracoccus sp. (in: a-proteobacteria)]MDO5632196.1 hypothetical protein [Paracoccus sp. (in: a-proteobacteria)]
MTMIHDPRAAGRIMMEEDCEQVIRFLKMAIASIETSEGDFIGVREAVRAQREALKISHRVYAGMPK